MTPSTFHRRQPLFPRWCWVVVWLLAASLSALPQSRAQDGSTYEPPIRVKDTGWVTSWIGAPSTTSNFQFASSAYNGTNAFNNQTLRLIVRVSLGGPRVRVRLSNEYGTDPLVVGAVHVALSDGAAGIVAGTDHVLTFNGGNASVTIPPGAPVLSEPVNFKVPALTNLAVSIYLPASVTVTTAVPTSVQTNYVAPANSGDNTGVATLPLDPDSPTILQWPILTGVDVRAPDARTFVVLGSSISLGALTTLNANARWPDVLAKRVHRNHLPLSVVDAGIVANGLLVNNTGLGGLARLSRDVLATPGAAYVFISDVLGVQCQSQTTIPADIICGLRQLIERAHSQNIRVYAGTILPLGGSGSYSEIFETNRQAVNTFIRTGGELDAYVDFDAALADPADPTRLLPAYDGGDHHHPNDLGNQVMAQQFDLVALFE